MKYEHIVFDIDGTLIDTEYAVLHSLQETIRVLSKTGHRKVLYIGDCKYDSKCAENAGIDFALAVWGSHSKHIKADYFLERPSDLLRYAVRGLSSQTESYTDAAKVRHGITYPVPYLFPARPYGINFL